MGHKADPRDGHRVPKNLLDRWQKMSDGSPRSNPAAIAKTANVNLNQNRQKASPWDDLWTEQVPMPGNTGEATELKSLGRIISGDTDLMAKGGAEQPATNNPKGMTFDKMIHVFSKLAPATITSAIRQNFRQPAANRAFTTRLADMKKDQPQE